MIKVEVFRGLGVCKLTSYSIFKTQLLKILSTLFTVKKYMHLASDLWKRIAYTSVLLDIKICTSIKKHYNELTKKYWKWQRNNKCTSQIYSHLKSVIIQNSC